MKNIGKLFLLVLCFVICLFSAGCLRTGVPNNSKNKEAKPDVMTFDGDVDESNITIISQILLGDAYMLALTVSDGKVHFSDRSSVTAQNLQEKMFILKI